MTKEKEELVHAFEELVDRALSARGEYASMEEAYKACREAGERLLRLWKQAFGTREEVAEGRDLYGMLSSLVEGVLLAFHREPGSRWYYVTNLLNSLDERPSEINRQDERYPKLVLTAVHRRLQVIAQCAVENARLMQNLRGGLQEAREALDAMAEVLAPHAAISVLAEEGK